MTRTGMYQLLAISAFFVSFVARASAHGAAPAAIGLLGFDGADATLVRLTRGMARRVPDGFRFVCPEAWGGDITAPAAAIPAGPALVAGETLFVVEPDGVVSPHPSKPGTGIALAHNRDALFGLFQRDDKYELQRITERTSELVRVLDEPFRLLVASDSELSLLGWTGRSVVLQRFSLDGESRQRAQCCAHGDVMRVERDGLGSPLFEIASLREPDYQGLSRRRAWIV